MTNKKFTFEQKKRFMAENDGLIRKLVDEAKACRPEKYEELYQIACVGVTKALNTCGDLGDNDLILHVTKCVRSELAVLA